MKKIIAGIVLALGLVGTANAAVSKGSEAMIQAAVKTISDMCYANPNNTEDPKECYNKYIVVFKQYAEEAFKKSR